MDTTTNYSRNHNTSSHGLWELVSDEQYRIFSFICYTIISPTICVFGIAGNSFAIFFLVRAAQKLRQSIYVYLAALTIADTLYMVVISTRSAIHIIGSFDELLYNYIHAYSFSSIIFMDLACKLLSASLMIAISLERLMAIRTPLFVKETILAKYPQKVILLIVMASLTICLPLPFCLEVKEVAGETSEGTKATLYEIARKQSMEEFLRVLLITHIVCIDYLPFIIIAFLNIAIPYQYWRIVNIRKRLMLEESQVMNTQLRIMMTVCVVLIMYTLLTLPNIIIQTLSVLDTDYTFTGSQMNMFWLFSDIGNLFSTINVAIDFIIYIWMSKTYRQRFARMVCMECFSSEETSSELPASRIYTIRHSSTSGMTMETTAN